MRIRLLALNIRNGGTRQLPSLLMSIQAHNPEVLLLCEFHNSSISAEFRKKLSDIGFPFQVCSHDKHRVNAILIASRQQFEIHPHEYLCFDPLRLFAVRFDRFYLIGVHMPNLKAKIPHWNALLRLASESQSEPWIFMGDFNTGKNPQDSEGYKFSCADYMEALENLGWVDAWRHFHPNTSEYSWYSYKLRGFRLDHAFLSPPLKPSLKNAFYDHAVREKKFSDHSALIIDLAL